MRLAAAQLANRQRSVRPAGGRGNERELDAQNETPIRNREIEGKQSCPSSGFPQEVTDRRTRNVHASVQHPCDAMTDTTPRRLLDSGLELTTTLIVLAGNRVAKAGLVSGFVDRQQFKQILIQFDFDVLYWNSPRSSAVVR